MLKKILIFLIFIYVFFSDILISLFDISIIKLLLSLAILVLFSLYFLINFKKLKNLQFVFYPSFLTILLVMIWPQMGYINLFYTTIFGWILCQNIKFSKKMLSITFLIQLLLVTYERFTSSVVYKSVTSGVLNENLYDYSKSFKLFDVTGFRPKGLFPGTLIATSFLIYLAMIYRNNIKILFLLFLSALITNGRLAILITGLTLFLKLYKSYSIIYFSRKLSPKKKLFFFIVPAFIFIIVMFISLPNNVTSNYIDVFDFTSTANAGRIYAYFQSLILFLSYSFTQKLFGLPGNEIYDIYDRVIASESGLISMLLDIGIIGLLFYLYYFVKGWFLYKTPLLNLKSKQIGFKYVVLITFLSFFQYEHINGNVRGTLFWFLFIYSFILFKDNKINVKQ